MMNLSRWFSDLRIRYKLLISYSLVFSLSLTLGNVITFFFVKKVIQTNIESELTNTTQTILNMVRTSAGVSIKNHLRAVAEKNKEIAQHFYKHAKSGKMTMEEAKNRTREVMLSQRIGKTGYIYCINSNGIILIHPEAALKNVDLSDYAFIGEQKKRKVGYLEYNWKNPGEVHPRPKALYMTYFKPWDWIISVSSYRNEFKELVNVDDFRHSILSLVFGQTGYSYVLDTQGNLIVHPSLEGNFFEATDIKGRQFIQEICRRKSGKIIYTWAPPGESTAREKLVIFNYIPEYKWIVASSSFLEEFYAPLKTINHIILATVVISFIFVLPITFRISSSITNPLQELMHRFASGAKGDISVRMQRQSRDEVGMLARYFNTFMEKLEDYSESLKAEIADRQKAEAAIRKSEAKYRELVENANSIILRMTPEGTITFFNEFAQKFFGYNEPEILGKSVIGTILPLKTPNGIQMMAGPASHRDQEEYANMLRDGNRVWIAWTSRAIQNASGTIKEYLCIGTDITESRQAVQEIARMRHYLKNFVDAIPSVLVGVDRKGLVTQWNRSAKQMTGIADHKALGRPVVELLPLLTSHMEMVYSAIKNGKSRQVEKNLCKHGQVSFYADIMVYPIDTGKTKGAVIRVDNVTQRVRMENIMVQTEKMMSVGGLAAGMAHEINNPLGGMLQNLQNVIRRLSMDLSENEIIAEKCGTRLEVIRSYLEQRGIFRFLENIRVSGVRASHIVENMLSFSRRSESRKAGVNMAELLDKVIELAAHDYDLKKKFDFRRIQIVRKYAQDMVPVPCVAPEIEQVIFNLLRNAAHAMIHPPQSKVLSSITIDLHREENCAVIIITDNGPGMDEHKLKRIFEPFFTTKEVGVGTGLGLSVSYFIITNNHNGSISADASPGKGASFTIRLPLSEQRMENSNP
ncbi:MAG: cache domain-containing protein [Desulfobacteraceae bacterium]|jgi:PAS domain S-box-containing protein